MSKTLPTLLWFLWALSAQGDEIVMPFSTGSTRTLYPFGLELAGLPSMRYQQLYEFDFTFTSGGPEYITDIWFRTDNPEGRGFTVRFQDVEMSLSTSQRNLETLSTVFDENIGADRTIVLGRGPLILGSPEATAYIPIHLARPFLYDPSQGNLVLEVINYQPNDPFNCPIGCAPPFDAELHPNDVVARVWAGDAYATSGQVDSMGLITVFYTTPIPEPASLWLFLGGVVGLGIGSGVDVTVLRLTGAQNPPSGTRHYWAVGHLLDSGGSLMNYFEISDLTIDCNLGAQSGSTFAVGAARIMGHHSKVRRVKAVNWGTRSSPGLNLSPSPQLGSSLFREE